MYSNNKRCINIEKSDKHKAKRIIGAPRVSGEHRVMYYLGDVATDIVKRRIGIVR